MPAAKAHKNTGSLKRLVRWGGTAGTKRDALPGAVKSVVSPSEIPAELVEASPTLKLITERSFFKQN